MTATSPTDVCGTPDTNRPVRIERGPPASLSCRPCSPALGAPAQGQVSVNQLGQAEMLGQGGWQDQPCIGHQAVIVEGDLDVVGIVAR